MPELPEVETIKRQLSDAIVGKKIKSVEIFEPRMIKVGQNVFKKTVIGATVKAVRRRAKLLITDLSNESSILIHLKMSGQLIYQPTHHPKFDSGSHKHTHIIYTFTDGSKLFHNDLRKFGFVKLIKIEMVPEYLEKENYGLEPMEKDFSLKDFKVRLSKQSRKKIKLALMDQKFIAGIGNLYADEICFYAGVRPTRIISTLSEKEIKKLFAGIKEILFEAVKYRGSSTDQYLDAKGNPGAFVPRLKVYGREEEKCFKCGTIIQRIKIGGRGAHFCSECQK
ncbi:MAG: DNA-formamidopyrimidine glycosylase [Candidatus Portnoybacteria bacterium]|nr:DNA-formamidopyrimidine glycosylase [Candidatus Portnoybacteria bacterium]